jgi:hypothetical protein
VTYPGTISLSTAHLTHLSDLLRGHRSRIGSRWRKLTAGQQALLALAHLRNGDTYARLAAGFSVGLATVYRYLCRRSRNSPGLSSRNSPGCGPRLMFYLVAAGVVEPVRPGRLLGR